MVCICIDFDLRFFLSGIVETRNVMLKGGTPKNWNFISAWSPSLAQLAKEWFTLSDIFNHICAFADFDAWHFMNDLLNLPRGNEGLAFTRPISDTDDCKISLSLCNSRERRSSSLRNISFTIEFILDLPR